MINIAKLLKDAPKGMKLYSPLFGEVEFDEIDLSNGSELAIRVRANLKSEFFNEFGQYNDNYPDAECLLFPSKEVRTWEGWKLHVQPKFKVGDRISWIGHDCDTQTIVEIKDGSYITVDKYGVRCALKFAKQDEWELATKSHYDIADFHAGMPVLVRDGDDEEWNYLLFSHYRKKLTDHFFAGGTPWSQCIPFNENTEYLLGTTDMPSEEFINW